MSQQWRAVGNAVSELTGPRFEPHTSAPETNALPLDQQAGNMNRSEALFESDSSFIFFDSFDPRFRINCYCNHSLFTKLPWPGDSEETFRFPSRATVCLPVYHTR